MIETFFIKPFTLARYRRGPAGPFVDAIAAALREQGYSRNAGGRVLFAVDCYARWLARRGWSLADSERDSVREYARSVRRYRSGRLRPRARGLERLFLPLLRELGITASKVAEPETEVGRWVRMFDGHLKDAVGLSAVTRRIYGRLVESLLRTKYGAGPVRWDALSAADISDYVQQEAARLKGSRDMPGTAVRGFLRFLVGRGLVSPGLVATVPSVRKWRLASLPCYVSSAEVERILDSCREGTAAGMRDRAVVLLLARMALRANEVAQIQISDFDWREGHLLIRAGKTRRERRLPLPQAVGAAVARYLKRARPRVREQRVFLRHFARHRPLSSLVITKIMIRRLQQAGVVTRRMGAHVLRHTAATQMVRRGATFKEVADVLGHQSLASTNIYAKLDIASLAQVAMPWMGGAR